MCTENRFFVGTIGAGQVAILKPPRGAMSRDDALNLAAWLVVLADGKHEITDLVSKVERT